MTLAGWRTSIGWVCAAALASNYVLIPLLSPFLLVYTGVEHVPVGMSDMMPVVMGLLGLSATRTFEKVKGGYDV